MNDISLIEFTPEHKEKRGVGVWFDTKDYTVPDFGKFQYKRRGDYHIWWERRFYYDELVDAVREYFVNIFGVNGLFVDLDGAIKEKLAMCLVVRILPHKAWSDTGEWNSGRKDLLEQSKEVTILLQVENNDNLQEKINQIQDAASAAEKKLENVDISVQVMADISPLSEYREQPNYYYFDYYHIDGIDYNDRDCLFGIIYCRQQIIL